MGDAITSSRQGFLLSLSDRIRLLTSPDQIMSAAAEALARHLGVAGAGYAEMEEDGERMTVGGQFTDGRMPAIKGRLSLSDFGEGFGPVLRAGEGVFSTDLTNDPRAPRGGSATTHAFGVRAAAAAPLVKDGRLVSCLYATHFEPRVWSIDDQHTFEEVAERTWDAVLRARADNARRVSEDKYRAVITSMDEAFVVGQVLYDEKGEPSDLLCLETNNAYLIQSGRTETVVGRTFKEITTGESSEWLSIYAEVARTRKAVRLDYGAPVGRDLKPRHIDLHVLPLGDPSEHKIAILFQNITERKLREQNLEFLSDIQNDLSRLSSADEIMNTVGRKICAYLHLPYAYFVQVDETRDEARLRYIWNGDDAPPLPEMFQLSTYITPEFRRMARAGQALIVRDTSDDIRTNADAYGARNMAAFIAVPFLKNGDWRFTLSVCDSAVRNWTRAEIEVVVELANRVFPRMERAIAEKAVADDLRDMKLLGELGAQLVSEPDRHALYEAVLTTAIELTHADAGTMQLLDRGTNELVVVATRGFSPQVVDHFARLDARSGTSCGRALAANRRVLLDFDAEAHAADEDMRLHVNDGYRSAQSTPLTTRAGVAIGMVSTHWKDQGHRATERELGFIDLLARQVSDLLELRRSEEELRDRQYELKEADRRKDEFIAMLAHELRNPLAPVRTGLELLRPSNATPEAVDRVRAMMARQVGHMVRLIDDLLDVSRITSGKIRLQKQPSAIASLVNTAVEANREALNTGDVALRLELPEGPALVDVDPTRFVQVVSNLLQNAVKFTDSGGAITIAARFEAHPDGSSREMVLTVADSGVGIPREALPYVFDLFTQGDANSERTKDGLGIGLALSRRLMELHGGSIDASSSGLGSGSVFTLRLPAPLVEPAAQAGDTDASPRRTTRRAVVIDDNRDAADTTAMLVSVMGGEVRVAYDGESGVREALDFHPDVIFLDIGMPGIDGYETCRRIRKVMGYGPTIVALTGWGQDQDQRETKRAGFDVHLTKPADPKVLERILAEAKLDS